MEAMRAAGVLLQYPYMQRACVLSARGIAWWICMVNWRVAPPLLFCVRFGIWSTRPRHCGASPLRGWRQFHQGQTRKGPSLRPARISRIQFSGKPGGG